MPTTVGDFHVCIVYVLPMLKVDLYFEERVSSP